MPIRTNRGRAAVYRRLWGWPLRSTAHLTVFVVIVAVLLTGIGVLVPKLVGDGGSKSPNRTGAAGPISVRPDDGRATPERNTGQPLPTRLTQEKESPTAAPPNPEAVRVAEQFAAAWVNHPDGVTLEAWMAGMKPFATDEFYPTLSTVEPANIPATKVTGPATPTSSLTSSLEAEVPTDGPKLIITVVSTNVGWRVSQFDRAD